MPPPDTPNTEADSSLPLDHAHILLTSFNSFLTVAIHNILYYRAIYPRETFLSTKAYNLPVHQNRHPKVCAWIRDAVDAVAVQLSAGHVSRIAIVIHTSPDATFTFPQPTFPPSSSSPPSTSNPFSSTSTSSSKPDPEDDDETILKPGTVLERWMIDTSRFPPWHIPTTTASKSSNPSNPTAAATSKAMRDFSRVLARDARSEDARERHLTLDAANSTLRWPDLDEQLRGALRRMAATAEAMGSPLPAGFQGDGEEGEGAGRCTFSVAVELDEEGRAPIGHPQAWIPSEPNLQPASRRGRDVAGEDIGGVRTRPVRAVEAGPLFFECWVEEGRAKEMLMQKKRKRDAEGGGSQGST